MNHVSIFFQALQNNFCMGGMECRTQIKCLQEDLIRTRTEKDNLLLKLKNEVIFDEFERKIIEITD